MADEGETEMTPYHFQQLNEVYHHLCGLNAYFEDKVFPNMALQTETYRCLKMVHLMLKRAQAWEE